MFTIGINIRKCLNIILIVLAILTILLGNYSLYKEVEIFCKNLNNTIISTNKILFMFFLNVLVVLVLVSILSVIAVIALKASFKKLQTKSSKLFLESFTLQTSMFYGCCNILYEHTTSYQIVTLVVLYILCGYLLGLLTYDILFKKEEHK